MNRTETYLDGRLIKDIGMVNVGPTADKPYDEWVDGRHMWLLDGREITEPAALHLIAEPPRRHVRVYAWASGSEPGSIVRHAHGPDEPCSADCDYSGMGGGR